MNDAVLIGQVRHLLCKSMIHGKLSDTLFVPDNHVNSKPSEFLSDKMFRRASLNDLVVVFHPDHELGILCIVSYLEIDTSEDQFNRCLNDYVELCPIQESTGKFDTEIYFSVNQSQAEIMHSYIGPLTVNIQIA